MHLLYFQLIFLDLKARESQDVKDLTPFSWECEILIHKCQNSVHIPSSRNCLLTSGCALGVTCPIDSSSRNILTSPESQ